MPNKLFPACRAIKNARQKLPFFCPDKYVQLGVERVVVDDVDERGYLASFPKYLYAFS
jgi:hypothetical protein